MQQRELYQDYYVATSKTRKLCFKGRERERWVTGEEHKAYALGYFL